MHRNRQDEYIYRRIAEADGLDADTVRSIILSFFDTISKEALALPFDNGRKIFTKEAFMLHESIHNIPYIGRLGTSYSRYLRCRAYASGGMLQKKRPKTHTGYTKSDIELIAQTVLSEGIMPEIKKKRKSEMYNNVWLVGTDGKKLAGQVIMKETDV